MGAPGEPQSLERMGFLTSKELKEALEAYDDRIAKEKEQEKVKPEFRRAFHYEGRGVKIDIELYIKEDK